MFQLISWFQFTSITINLASILLFVGLLAPNIAQAKEVEIIRSSEIEDQVKLRVKVTDDQKRPITTLEKKDYRLKVIDKSSNELILPHSPDNGYSDIDFRFKTPKEAEQPPAYILFLLDMSGSMKCSTDLRSTNVCDKTIPKGQRKLDVAIDAIRTFIEEAKERKGNTNIAIIPFGYGNIYQHIDSQDDLDKFYNVADAKHITTLENLSQNIGDDATNIFHSLEEVIKFFTNPNDNPERFYPVDKEGEPIEPEPRLAVILLTDGYDTDKNLSHNDKNQKLKNIQDAVQGNNQITIHTLGYGLTPEQLGQKFKLGGPAKLSDTKSQAIAYEFLDVEKLQQISKITPNGLYEISGNASDITSKLQLFLNAILGEYEITYKHPNPQRARQYQVVVSANNINSDPEEYRVTVFGRFVSPPIYLISVALVGILGGFWLIPYFVWKNNLQQNS